MSEYFDRITANCQPHEVFSKDWTTPHSSADFASTFLPKVTIDLFKGAKAYDGAELFPSSKIVDESKIQLSIFTYPNVVLAHEKRGLVTASANEVLAFIDISIDNFIVIHFKFGEVFKKLLQVYIDTNKKEASVTALENGSYSTTKERFDVFIQTLSQTKFSANAGYTYKVLFIIRILGLEAGFFSTAKKIEDAVIEEEKQKAALSNFLAKNDFSGLKYATVEEKKMLDPSKALWGSNKILLGKDPVIEKLIGNLKIGLDLVNSTIADITLLLQKSGAELLSTAKLRIRKKGQAFSNKDGILYIARLKMNVLLKNHPKLISLSETDRNKLSLAFEKASKGLEGTESPNFSGYSGSFKKILISGFDPFGSGLDWQNELSNPSGNIALSLDGVELTNGSKKGIIRSALFPVRWTDFDEKIVEDFFEPFFEEAKKVDMIITFSYGVHYLAEIKHDYHLERFAANYRGGGPDNNDFDPGTKKLFELKAEEYDLSYIETTLPLEKLEDGTTGKVKVPNFNVVINHGPFSQDIFPFKGNTTHFNWEVWGTSKTSGQEINLTKSLNFNQPENLFPQPFQTYTSDNAIDPSLPLLKRNVLIADSDELKYYVKGTDTAPNSNYIPPVKWDNYKDPSLEADYKNIRIEAHGGSGGSYMSNEIYYRVATLREKAKKNNIKIPTGHIHMGFNKVDPNTDRDKMLEDIQFMIRQFLATL